MPATATVTKALLCCAVFGIGLLQPVQAGANAEFRRHAGHALQATTLNMLVGASVVLLLAAVMRAGVPSWSAIQSAPWWAFVGGAIGGILTLTLLTSAPILGAALMISIFVVGQVLSSTVIDHFGLVGYPVRAASPGRLLGVALLIAGVMLIERTS